MTRLQMERWEPWVRAYTAVGEMLQGISFQDSRGQCIPGPVVRRIT